MVFYIVGIFYSSQDGSSGRSHDKWVDSMNYKSIII